MKVFSDKNNLINPYSLYNKIRDEKPVYEIEPGVWIISKYEDVKNGLRDYRRFTSKRKLDVCISPLLRKDCRSDLFIATEDPPEHILLRNVISFPFKKPSVDKLREHTIKQAKKSVSRIKDKKDIEFFKDFSYPYVAESINHLFGTDGIQTHEESHEWIKAQEATTKDMSTLSIDETRAIEETILNQKSLFNNLINDRKRNPKNDFISDLVSKSIEGKELTNKQLISSLELIYRGGYQTTVHLLSMSAIKLIRHDEHREKLINSASLIPVFINEMLRLYSPVPMILRHATQNITIRGKTIKKGDSVWFLLAAADRDPDIFSSPDNIDLSEMKGPILGFGYGPHICLGLYLARLHTEIAIQYLLPLFENMSCPPDHELKWIDSVIFRGIEDLQLKNFN